MMIRVMTILCVGVPSIPSGEATGFLGRAGSGESTRTSTRTSTTLATTRATTPTPAVYDNASELLGDARWAANVSALAAYTPPPAVGQFGFPYIATTTRYGTNPFTACDMDSAALVAGTDYLPVASAQAMQDKFKYGSCCRCGEAGPGTGGDSPTAGMGCGSCGRGRFVRQLPRGFYIWTPEEATIFQKEWNIVVVDICPKAQNGMWCPAAPSSTNSFGVHNHFDFAITPPRFDNFYFAFEPAECSPELKQRISKMSTCHP